MQKYLHRLIVLSLFFAGVSMMQAATTPVTVNLNDGSGNPISSGATLRFADNAGWHTATNNGDGTFTANVDGTNIQYQMKYNHGVQSITTTANPVTFQTTTTTVKLEDAGGNSLSGGQFQHAQDGWSPQVDANTSVELLPGNYTFTMKYHNGVQHLSSVNISGTTDEVLFTTVATTVKLEDSDGNSLSGGKVQYAQNGWSPQVDANTSVELLPGNYTFTMRYKNGVQSLNGVNISGATDEVLFTTLTTTVKLEDTDGNSLNGGQVQYAQNGWSPQFDANSSIELLPGSYGFTMRYNHGVQNVNGVNINTDGQEVTFTTLTVTPKLVDCDGNELSGGQVQYAQNGWSPQVDANTSVELLPGNYTFTMRYNHGVQNQNGVNINTDNQEVTYAATQVNYVFGGTVKFAQNGWGTYTQGMYFLPGSYTFQFGNQTYSNFTISGCTMDGNVNIFRTLKHDGSPLPNTPIYRNDYGNHYVKVGETDANGLLFSTDLPNGVWKYRATKDFTSQYIISGPNLHNFQTSKFITHVKHTDGSDFEGVTATYNDYGNHWIYLDNQHTDANGNASIELFPGNYKFRATKDFSDQSGYLEITNSGQTGVINFQTSTFTAHVKHTDGSDFEGVTATYNDYGNHWIYLDNQHTDANGNASIELFPGNYKFRATKDFSNQSGYLEITNSGQTGVINFQTSTFTAHVTTHDGADQPGVAAMYNDYGNHWIYLSPKYTDANGNASIELFPGNYTFRATKDFSSQTEDLEITNSGATGVVEFQTALAQVLVKDCDLNVGVAGINVRYNDYGNHWINLSPTYSDVDGLASIELFPGTYSFSGNNISTSEVKQMTLTRPSTQIEFNPTRVTLNYSGKVLYNDYGNHWYTMHDNTYMFAGTYDFRFYNSNNVLDKAMPVSISGCSVDQALIFVQLQNSNGGDLAGGNFDYRYGWGAYTDLGTDATGSGFWAFVSGNPTYTKVRVSYKGATLEKQQNIHTNPEFIFNTANVTADLKSSTGDDLTADNWQYRYGWGAYTTLNPNGEELLPVYTKVRVSYKGATVEKQQNVASNPHFAFSTVNVTAALKSSTGDDLTADNWQYRYGWGAYTTLNPNGEELLPVYTKVKVSYKGASVEEQQNVASNPYFEFNTKLVTAELLSSTGANLTADKYQYRYGWGSYTDLDPNGEELLPVTTKVKVHYKHACVEEQQNVNSLSNFVFNTKLVTAELLSSTGANLTADKYQYRYGWGAYYPLDPNGEELLPVTTKVKVHYKHACVEEQQNVNSDASYEFNTVLVTADLKDTQNNTLTADSWSYRYGWGSYYTLNNAGEELLPLTVKVKATYNGEAKEKQQNVKTAPDYHFTWDGNALYKSDSEDFTSTLKEVKVYPNPSDGKFIIDNIDSFDNLAIYDLTGRLIYSKELADESTVNILLDNPVAGTYVIKLDGINSSINTPLIIK